MYETQNVPHTDTRGLREEKVVNESFGDSPIVMSADRVNTIGFSSCYTDRIRSFDEAVSLLKAPEMETRQRLFSFCFLLVTA